MENSFKNMKMGDTEIIKVEANIDESFYRTKFGHRLGRNERVKVKNKDGKFSEFKVHRIMGKTFIVLVEDGVTPKLSFLDAARICWQALTKRRF